MPANECCLRTSRKEDQITSKLFIGNLSYETTQDELQAVFAEAGEIVDVFLPVDRNTGRPRGFAFIEFGDEIAAAEAIRKYDGFELKGRKLRVSEAQERRRPSAPPAFDRAPHQDSYNSGRPSKPKGSRRNLRGKKRSL